VDESPRFVDQPTDLGDVLARSREYGVGVTLITQSLSLFPNTLRGIAINSLRTKVAFGEVADDARRLADAFGPTVTPDMLTGLAAFEAIGSVSVGGAVSDPVTFKTLPLEPPIPGRAKAVRTASRNRWGIPRAEIEASFKPRGPGPGEGPGPVGRRQLP
jgi:DNA helicase HerA-like ATPase